jgi:hypothetical protein
MGYITYYYLDTEVDPTGIDLEVHKENISKLTGWDTQYDIFDNDIKDYEEKVKSCTIEYSITVPDVVFRLDQNGEDENDKYVHFIKAGRCVTKCKIVEHYYAPGMFDDDENEGRFIVLRLDTLCVDDMDVETSSPKIHEHLSDATIRCDKLSELGIPAQVVPLNL